MHNPKAVAVSLIFGWLLLVQVSSCAAIDNPEAPDRLKAFENRSEGFETDIREGAKNEAEIVAAYGRYNEFLDKELNQTYGALSKQLDGNAKQALLRSQRLWLQFRDAEYSFIDDNWTPTNFGSSSSLSRSAYRATLIKHRILELLHYLKNYRQSDG